VAPLLGADGEASDIAKTLWKRNGERLKPFSFVQLSDTHVGFNGPPDPLGTQAYERAVDMINGLRHRPDFVLVTGDLTHDSEKPGEHADRMKRFREISNRLHVDAVRCVPGEHDAGLDGGALFRDVFGPTFYSFDHRGVHFIGLDNVSRAKPEVGPEQLAWLKKDLARFPTVAPIVVFTHRPLFDLKPEWEWFTSDGDEVMNALASYENVTVLYGHIHRQHEHAAGGGRVYFVEPKDGATVKSPVKFQFAADNFTIAPVPAGTVEHPREGTGHHHLGVEMDCLPPGQEIPKGTPGWVHFGKGDNTIEMQLTPGKHKFSLEAGDDLHRTIPGLCQTITINVEP